MAGLIALVLPVHNEADILPKSFGTLYSFIKNRSMDHCKIVIADSSSTDGTSGVAKELARDPSVTYMQVPEVGKGAAIKKAWLSLGDDFEIFAFMDADLSTDLAALPGLIDGIRAGYDVVVGSRYVAGSRVHRSLGRELISRSYRVLFGIVLRAKIKDPQCGFKAIARPVRDHVLPQVKSRGFFFDTELLVRAAAAGYSIREIPINWSECPGSSIRLLNDVPEFLSGLVTLKYRMISEAWSRPDVPR